MLSIYNTLEIFRDENFKQNISNKQQFLISMLSFMRGYTNIVGNSLIFTDLSKIMHGYETTKININDKYNSIFGVDILETNYEIDINDILQVTIADEIVDKVQYPLLNKTLIHSLNYLQLRLLVENTLYNTDTTKIDTSKNPKLYDIIKTYLDNDSIRQTDLLSKKTLLNEFNHFEFDMCLFLPSLDISDTKLEEEKNAIMAMCKDIKTNGI